MSRYKPKKKKRPVEAIREMCIECMGGRNSGQPLSKLISECTVPDCAVYEFRFGKNPYHKQKLSKEQRKSLSDRAKNSPLIRRAVGKIPSNLNDPYRTNGLDRGK